MIYYICKGVLTMKPSNRKLKKYRKRKPMVHRSFAEKRGRKDKDLREAKLLTKRQFYGIIYMYEGGEYMKKIMRWLLTDINGNKPNIFYNILGIIFILVLLGFILW